MGDGLSDEVAHVFIGEGPVWTLVFILIVSIGFGVRWMMKREERRADELSRLVESRTRTDEQVVAALHSFKDALNALNESVSHCREVQLSRESGRRSR